VRNILKQTNNIACGIT